MPFSMSLAITLFLVSGSQNAVEFATTILPIGGLYDRSARVTEASMFLRKGVLPWKRTVMYKLEDLESVKFLFPPVVVHNEEPRGISAVRFPHFCVSECCACC
jgi:hypothetical protein